MNHKFENILDDCIQAIQAGESLESCLERYPQQAEELLSLLTTAELIGSFSIPIPSDDALEKSRQKMLAELQRKSGFQAVSNSPFSRYTNQLQESLTNFKEMITRKETQVNLRLRLLVTVLMVAILVVTFGGVTAVSASALPGDALYSLKTSVQDVQLYLTRNPDARSALEQSIRQSRLNDIRNVLQNGQNVKVEFSAEITEIGADYIVAGGLVVRFDENTEMAQTLDVGMLVGVEAVTQSDGSLLATEINSQNEIGDPIETVEPMETPDPDDLLDEDETPEPTETPQPTETSDPEDVFDDDETPEASETSDPDDDDLDETPEPLETEHDDDDLNDDDTPEPDDTIEPDDDRDDDTPEPDDTQEPDDDDQGEDQPDPDDDDQPDPDDDDQPDPDDSPEPDDDDHEDNSSDPDDD